MYGFIFYGKIIIHTIINMLLYYYYESYNNYIQNSIQGPTRFLIHVVFAVNTLPLMRINTTLCNCFYIKHKQI